MQTQSQGKYKDHMRSLVVTNNEARNKLSLEQIYNITLK